MSQKSLAEEAVQAAWKRGPLKKTLLKSEVVFCLNRRWRFDLAILPARIAIEIEGRGRHQTIAGTRNDCEKYNAAAELGWFVLRFPATDIKAKNQFSEPLIDLFIEQVCRMICGMDGPHQDAFR